MTDMSYQTIAALEIAIANEICRKEGHDVESQETDSGTTIHYCAQCGRALFARYDEDGIWYSEDL